MLRIAHVSDLHILDLEGSHWRRFLNKRLTGGLNLMGLRRRAHPTEMAERLVDDLVAGGFDHVLLTGDVSNLALESEFERAVSILRRLGDGTRLTVIPGNHDAYTRGAARDGRFEKYFASWQGDAPLDGHHHYPFVKHIAGGVVIYGMSSAIPTPPLLAYGRVGRHQLQRLRELHAVESPRATFRIVMVHHNMHHRAGPAEYTASLQDRHAFALAMRDIDASLVVHGHTHGAHQGCIRRRHGAPPIPVIGCGSSTWNSDHWRHHARYNVYHIDDGKLLRVERHIHDHDDEGAFTSDGVDLLPRALSSPIAI